MSDNPIVEEVHRIREELLAEHGGDVDRLVDELQRRTAAAARAGAKASARTSRVPPPDRTSPQSKPRRKAG